jgi:hypothetical protein
MIDHFDPDMIAASFEVLQPILLEHGYGADDVAQLNADCVAEVSAFPPQVSLLRAQADHCLDRITADRGR